MKDRRPQWSECAGLNAKHQTKISVTHALQKIPQQCKGWIFIFVWIVTWEREALPVLWSCRTSSILAPGSDRICMLGLYDHTKTAASAAEVIHSWLCKNLPPFDTLSWWGISGQVTFLKEKNKHLTLAMWPYSVMIKNVFMCLITSFLESTRRWNASFDSSWTMCREKVSRSCAWNSAQLVF